MQEALRAIASLVSKSEKAQQKLAPGTWQHAMLRDHLKALHIAMEVMRQDADEAEGFDPGDLQEALEALSSLIRRTDKAMSNFSPGISQHTLLLNRLGALRIAESLIDARLNPRWGGGARPGKVGS